MMFYFRDKNKKDPESEKIWERLKESEAGWCCKMIQQIPHHSRGITLVLPDGTSCSYLIAYCPKCGRRLEDK